MAKIIDTFSANSLKILDKNIEEFKNKFVYNLSLFKKDDRATLGQKFHALICAYINNFDVSKMILNLNDKEKNIWENLKNILKDKKENFIHTEFPFLIKEDLNGWNYYLTGRYDAIYKENDEYIIYDWKTLNLPREAENDLQSVVYLFCANKIFKTEKIKMRYLSIEKLNFIDIYFENNEKYKNHIEKIILKLEENNDDMIKY